MLPEEAAWTLLSRLLQGGAVISQEYRGLAVRVATNGFREMVEHLLQDGAVISQEDRGLAVRDAAERGFREMVEHLLQDGAVISQEDRGLAMRAAIRNGHLRIVLLLQRLPEVRSVHLYLALAAIMAGALVGVMLFHK